jgi:hypothetical protein
MKWGMEKGMEEGMTTTPCSYEELRGTTAQQLSPLAFLRPPAVSTATHFHNYRRRCTMEGGQAHPETTPTTGLGPLSAKCRLGGLPSAWTTNATSVIDWKVLMVIDTALTTTNSTVPTRTGGVVIVPVVRDTAPTSNSGTVSLNEGAWRDQEV